MSTTKNNLLAATIGAVVASALAGGVAWATIPDDGGVIQGCYTKVGGIVRVIDTAKGQHCLGIELPITWNQKGPKGDPGPSGAPGAAGDKGDKGDPGPAGSGGGSTPVGTVVSYAGSAAPPGWLVADGSSVSRSTYPELFATIGTTYGAADGSTFTLPDLRGRVVVAVGSNGDVAALGQNDGGAEPSRSPLHTHSVPAHSHGVGTLAVGVAGGGGTVPGSFTQVLRCETSQTSQCQTGAYGPENINTLGGGFPSSANASVGGGAHSHGLGGRVGDTAGVDGDQPMTSGANGPSYIALTYLIRAD